MNSIFNSLSYWYRIAVYIISLNKRSGAYLKFFCILLLFLRKKGFLVKFKFCYLSHKLRCYKGISGPEKSRNNTREKISYFFTCVDIANQLLIRHSPLAPLGQVDE